jgi:hypothetical protein
LRGVPPGGRAKMRSGTSGIRGHCLTPRGARLIFLYSARVRMGAFGSTAAIDCRIRRPKPRRLLPHVPLAHWSRRVSYQTVFRDHYHVNDPAWFPPESTCAGASVGRVAGCACRGGKGEPPAYGLRILGGEGMKGEVAGLRSTRFPWLRGEGRGRWCMLARDRGARAYCGRFWLLSVVRPCRSWCK